MIFTIIEQLQPYLLYLGIFAGLLVIFLVLLCLPKKNVKKQAEEPKEAAPVEEPAEEEKKEEPAEEEQAEEPAEEEKVEEPAEEEKAEEPVEEEQAEEPAEEEKAEEPAEEEKAEEPAEEEKAEEPAEEEKAEEPVEEKAEEPAEEEKKEEPAEEEKAEEPVEEKKPEQAPVAEPIEKAKTSGKWVIKKKSEEDYVWNLIANNGEIILASESYTNAAGAKLGLQSIRDNIAQSRFQIHSDKNDHYFFKLKNGANKLQAMGQVYSTKKSAQSSVNSVKRFSESAEIIEEVVEEMTYSKYEAKEPINVEGVKDAYRGKWVIEKFEDYYQAKLYASNGEVILVTERYASSNSVYSAIENIKKNVANNNFIIDCDKNKRFFYRLRNENRLTLAIGEAYEKKPSCINSIDSVRRFSATAEITEKEEVPAEEAK